jgi:hypothetical protein
MNAWQTDKKGVHINDARSAESILSYNGNTSTKFYLGMQFKTGDPFLVFQQKYPVFTPQINDISMQMPPVAALYQYDQIPKDMICDYEQSSYCSNSSKFCRCFHVLEVGLNDLVEIVLFNKDPLFFVPYSQPIHPSKIALSFFKFPPPLDIFCTWKYVFSSFARPSFCSDWFWLRK